jgi:hypothetical protein
MEWDSKEWREARDVKLRSWFLNNEAAVQFYISFSAICETWDDLVDRDVKITPMDINRAFINALIGMPMNPFYTKYRAAFEPFIVMTINGWLDSEEFIQRGGEKSRMLAFHIRNLGIEIAPLIAFYLGGYIHMRNVSMEIRDFFAHETYAEWEHRHAE